MLIALALVLLAPIVAVLAHPAAASAAPSKPGTTLSYYVTTTSTSKMYNLGYIQGTHDQSNGSAGRETLLDFGQQSTSGTSAEIFDANGTWVSSSQIESMVEQFAYGYWIGTGSATYATIFLEIGTSTFGPSGYDNGYAWAGIVNTAWNWVKNNGMSSQVIIQGGNDMEPGWASYSTTRDWANGYAARTTQLYLDYGSADGCPYDGGEHVNGACGTSQYSWTQGNVWYVAYGHDDAVAAPEIYYKSMANQWASISWYSKNYHSSEMAYIAPWDEYGLDHSTDTPTQAWNNLWDSSAALGVATTPPYSMEVSYE